MYGCIATGLSAVLFLCANASGQVYLHRPDAPVRPVRYTEIQGTREFSGQLLARPIQHEAWLASGLDADQTRARMLIAHTAVSTYAVRHYVWDTDEYIIDCPQGRSENDVANELLALGCFSYVEPNWILYPLVLPNDPLLPNQWHHAADRMNSAAAWDIHTGLPTVSVGICDTGVLVTHEDLLLHRLEGFNAVDQLFESQGGDITPVHPHGTQTTGCAAANGNNALGVSGVGWNLSHRMLRVSNLPSGNSSLATLQLAARTAIESGDRVASISFSGVDTASNLTTATLIKQMGGLLVWAAGNDNRNLVFGDRDLDDIIVVGATDELDNKSSFSAFGPFVDVFAPGSNVVTTTATTNSSYAAVSGTSFATPLTAGLIALIWSLEPALTPAQVEARLKQGADDLGTPGVDDIFGYGRIDALNSLSPGAGAQPPIADAGPDIVAGDGDGNGFEAVTLDGSASFDPDGGAIVTFEWTEGVTLLGSTAVVTPLFAQGVHIVTLTVTDDELITATDTAVITVTPNQPPIADAGPDITVIDTDGTGDELVTLDGSGSFDLDGTIVAFQWSEGAVVLGAGETLAALFPVGDHIVTLTVTDNGGAPGSSVVLVTVQPQSTNPVSIAFDGFESGTFAGGTGAWIDAWATPGDVRNMTSDGPHAGSRHARLRKLDTSLSRTADLSGATNVHLTFWAKPLDFEGADQAVIRVSPDGAVFTPVAVLTGADTNDLYQFFDIDLAGFAMTGTFQVQFDSDMDKGFLFVDDVEFTGFIGPPVNQAPVADAGPDITATDADGDGLEAVTLDGSASFDPDGFITAFEWREGPTLLGTTAVLNVALNVGVHSLSLTVTDDEFATGCDAVMVTVLPQSTTPVPLASDGFESGNFAGGTGAWAGAWATSGDVRNMTNDGPHSGTRHARLRKDGAAMSRTANLAGASGARLAVWLKAGQFEGPTQASVRVSPDGVNFTTVVVLTGADSDDTYHFFDVDLSGFTMTPGFRIEFRLDGDKGFLFVDDVEITGSTG